MSTVNSKIEHAIVTGSSGFIGRALVLNLVAKGVEVIAVDRKPFIGNICQSAVLDIAVPNALDQFIKSNTVIFHMAAKASVPGSVASPAEDFYDTCYGFFQVLESARRMECKVIFPSTASIFDINCELPLTEKSFVKPSSPYGAAKVSGESYCYVYHKCYDTDVRIARMFSVYGIGMNRFAIHDIIRKIQKNNKELILLGNGEQIRDYLYIDDIINGLVVIACNGAPGEDYNLASGQSVRIIDLARNIASLMGFPDIKISLTGDSFPGDVQKWYGDISKIQSIGFKQSTSLSEGLKKTIKWIESNTSGEIL